MAKSHFVEHFVKHFGVTLQEASEYVSQYASSAMEQLQKDKVVLLPGIGRLTLKERKARMARNPRTGEQVRVPAKHVIKFSPSLELKKMALSLPPEIV